MVIIRSITNYDKYIFEEIISGSSRQTDWLNCQKKFHAVFFMIFNSNFLKVPVYPVALHGDIIDF